MYSQVSKEKFHRVSILPLIPHVHPALNNKQIKLYFKTVHRYHHMV